MFDHAPLINAADPVDVHVGRMIRQRRKALHLTQIQVADAIGLTFQQQQKYERGQNRVSASKLHAIGKALGVPVSYFFEGLDNPEPVETTPEATEVSVLFTRIESALDRAAILTLVRALAKKIEA